MAIAAQTSAEIFLGSYRFTVNATNVNVGLHVDVKDATTFGSGGFEQFVPGLKVLTLNLQGLTDYAAGAYDEWIRTSYGTVQVASVSPGVMAVGNTVVITQGIPETNENFGGHVGDISKVSTAVKPVGNVVAQGQVTNITAPTITVTGNTTPVQVGALGALQQAYAAIHVVTIAGTATPTLTCQLASSPTSGGAYTTRGAAGAGLTAIGGQFLATGILGVITDTWWRLNYTVSGTSPIFTVFASIAVA